MNKKLIIRIILFNILTLSSHYSFAQIFDNEQAHPADKWRSITTANYRLLFPQEFEPAAQNLAKELQTFIESSSKDLGVIPKKITLVLQGNHLNQNGYVQLAPRKSEMYPVPSSTADNQEWLPNLALHEMRHVAQFDKLTGKIKGPFFEQLALALYALNLPAWYFEGDAVQVETLYSQGGRGRLPSWEMPIRANILSGKNYGFSKYVLGSFRDNIPSYYTIGYLMNTYLTNNFGIDSQEKILENMRGKLVRPFNFQRSLQSVSGLNSKQLFTKTIQDLTAKWEHERPIEGPPFAVIETKKSRFPTDFLLPQYDTNNRLFVLKSSPQKVNEIVMLEESGAEKTIHKTGIQITPYFHLRGTEIVWDEYRKDARFGKRTYNVIHTLDTKNKQLKTLTKGSRYYSPTLHPTKNEVAVVEVLHDNRSRIVILNSKNGHVLDSLSALNATHIQQPRYNNIGDKLICIAVSKAGTSLLEFDLTTRQSTVRLPAGNQQLERPIYRNNDIVFKAHYNGIDNIYQLQNNQIQQVTQATFGAFNPSLGPEETLVYNNYAYDGYKLASQKLNQITDTDTVTRAIYINKTLQTVTFPTAQPLSDDFPVQKYNPTAHLINFHSLSISGTNFETFDNYIPGIFWLSNDLLNTTQIKLGYEFDTDINKSIYSAEVSYRRFFPIFTAKYTNRGQVGNAVNSAKPGSTVMFDYKEHLVTFDMSLPFSIYRQNQVYSFGFNMGTSYTKRYNLSLDLKNFNDEIAFPLSYQVYFNRNNMRSKLDLLPRWGQNVSITYRHLPFETQISGNILSLRSNFYLPGLVTNHSIQARFALQRSTGRYQNSYDIPMVSGWGHFTSPIVHNTAMVNYRLPLFYPDWDLGSIFYIKRIQGLVFSDFQNIHQEVTPKSMGLGLSADFNVFKYNLPDVNVGTKLTYLNDGSASNKIVPTFTLSYTY
ncbi:hypothetical protein [Sphingobacterium psychroaquaticum]|uniref:WD40-like Beta Propeller Repeat n=1 Tax=Sphingobacterium psychroaquaticum TaxID=561061 RepID=A0A1X7HYQ1_9SPHI|nr:hypothetical protein [Sphingobacterium psychroaquaticum]SMG07120.1 hypothetical protein SAMN05660862_0253 [Sphingobacterium psychroaquaticum]